MRTHSHRRSAFFAWALFLSSALAVFADSDVIPPDGRAFASSNGKYFLILSPVGERKESWLWTMYNVDERGLFKESWCRDGTYARRILIADDGVHVACMETWPSGRPTKSTPLIAIYRENELVKAIRLQDIVRDISELPTSVSHYQWLDENVSPFARGDYLSFKTAMGDSYVVTLPTGALALVPAAEKR